MHVVFVPISGRFNTNRPDIVFPALAAELALLLQKSLDIPSVAAVETYRDIIADLLRELASADRPCLLVFDGADETLMAGWELGPTLLPASAGGSLRILVSARPLAGDSGAEGWRTRLGWVPPATAAVTEIELGRLSRAAVASLVESAAGEGTQDREGLVNEVFRLCDDGDPLLVELYAADIAQAVQLKGLDAFQRRLSSRGSGLRGYFEDWMYQRARAFAEAEDSGLVSVGVVEATLVLLAASMGPIRHEELLQLLTRVVPDDAIPARYDLLRPLARFILGDGEEQGYTLGHPRFAVFLLEEQYASTPLLEAARRAYLSWGDDAAAALLESREASVPSYLLAWYPFHLLRSQETSLERFHGVLSRSWIAASRRAIGEASVAIALQASLEAFVSTHRELGGLGTERMVLMLRAAVFLSSISSAARVSDVSLLADAFECGVLDTAAIETRLLDLRVDDQVRLLASIARSQRAGVDRREIWRRAVDTAQSAPPQARADLLAHLLRETDGGGDPANDGWNDRLGLLELWLDALAKASLTELRLPRPFRGSIQAGSLERLSSPDKYLDLVAIVGGSRGSPGFVVALVRAIAESFLEGGPAATDGELAEVAAKLFDRAAASECAARPVAQAALSLLSARRELSMAPRQTIDAALAHCAPGEETLTAVAVLIGLLASLGGPYSAIMELLSIGMRRLETDAPKEYVLLLLASPFAGLHEAALERLCANAWKAVARTRSSRERAVLELGLAGLPGPPTLVAAAATASIERGSFWEAANLLKAAGHRLPASVLQRLISSLASADSELARTTSDAILRQATEASRAELARVLHALGVLTVVRPTTRDDELAKQVESRFLGAGSADDSELDLENALELVSSIERAWHRAHLLRRIAGKVPLAKRADVIRAALAAAASIGDGGVAVGTVAELSALAVPSDGESAFRWAVDFVRALAPEDVVHGLCNASFHLGVAQNAILAPIAMAASERPSKSGSSSSEMMVRVIECFGGRVTHEFVGRCLKNVAVAHRADYLYAKMIQHGRNGSLRALWPCVRRLRSVTPPEGVRTACALLCEYPLLFGYLESRALESLEFVREKPERLHLLVEVMWRSRGRRRTLFEKGAVAVLLELLGDDGIAPLGADSHLPRLWEHSIVNLLNAVAPATRKQIVDAIAQLPTATRLAYEKAVFPALSPEERSRNQSRLLRDTEESLGARGDEQSMDLRLRQAGTLFQYWVGESRLAALHTLIRVSAASSRRYLLYRLPGLVRQLSVETRPALASGLVAAIQDALALWP